MYEVPRWRSADRCTWLCTHGPPSVFIRTCVANGKVMTIHVMPIEVLIGIHVPPLCFREGNSRWLMSLGIG